MNASDAKPAWIAALIAAAACLVVFTWMLTFGTFRIVVEDSFGSFYDYQALAWLHGHWDVPERALGGEAFVVDDKVYGYFGPTPAVMRLPFVASGVGFGKLTRACMIVDYITYLAGAHALLRFAARRRPCCSAPHASSVVLYLTTVGLGSTVFFLSSRAYVYHEAILCGAAFAVWSIFCTLRYLQAPNMRWWLGAWICGVGAVEARPPIGLFALSVLGAAAIFVILRSHRAKLVKTHLGIFILSIMGVLIYNVTSYLKFGTFDGCPLRYNVQYTADQLTQLAGRNFHLNNLRFNTDAYLLHPSFSLRSGFPYIYREYIDRRRYPESRIAYRDQTLAIPWSMPGFFALGVGGGLVAFAGMHACRTLLLVGALGAIPASFAMLTAVAVTQRYEADFCLFLIVPAAFGTVASEVLPKATRTFVAITIWTLSIAGMLISFALTLHHQREIVWGVPEEMRQNYREFAQRVDAFFNEKQRH
jgi:hypothetical protein